jgi:Bacteriophage baseplate protein W
MGAGVFTLADITSADWSLALDTPGLPGSGLGQVVQGLADVGQCIGIILTTPKGSDPLRPTFGADIWRFIDNPINSAIPAIVREVTEAITLWEPRVMLTGVTAQPANDNDTQSTAHLEVNVKWRLKLSTNGTAPSPLATAQITTVTVPAL